MTPELKCGRGKKKKKKKKKNLGKKMFFKKKRKKTRKGVESRCVRSDVLISCICVCTVHWCWSRTHFLCFSSLSPLLVPLSEWLLLLRYILSMAFTASVR
uniref:Uncharacterized protein n=1 Tax=Scleropages formosus TaxID=113540 RepID=A0A8C9T0B2_SCLFO